MPGTDSAMQLLVIDDDVQLCQLIGEYFETEHFGTEAVHAAAEGVERALSGEHALVILDVMLPGFNGLEVLRRIRAESAIPILMLTARGDEADRIRGLELGADDYLPKPFNPRELAARIQAILRRGVGPGSSSARSVAPKVVVGDVTLDLGTRQVLRCGEAVEMTSTQFSLLAHLLRFAGRIVTREELSEEVLGRPLARYDRCIDVHVSNLRRKLGPTVQGVERIRSVRGSGYLYALTGEAAE